MPTRILVLFACYCTGASSLLLVPALRPAPTGCVASVASSRTGNLRCEEIPEEVAKQIPPEKLAMAWKREEEAKELAELLKGCQLYMVGLSARKNAVGRALARRLQTYRLLDVPALMLSTYKALSGGEAAVSMEQLMASEPVEDVAQLSASVMREVQQYTRSVIVTWDGAVETSDYMTMQQGIVACLQFEGNADDIYLPAENGEEVLERWREGHEKADVSVDVAAGVAPDDAAALLVSELVAFIKKNPAKSAEWKATADAKLAEKDSDDDE